MTTITEQPVTKRFDPNFHAHMTVPGVTEWHSHPLTDHPGQRPYYLAHLRRRMPTGTPDAKRQYDTASRCTAAAFGHSD